MIAKQADGSLKAEAATVRAGFLGLGKRPETAPGQPLIGAVSSG